MFTNIRKVYTNYGAHKQTSLYGTIFGFGGIYTNYQMLCLTMALYYDNKSENTWTKFMSFLNISEDRP